MQYGFNSWGSTVWGGGAEDGKPEVQVFSEYFNQPAWERDNVGSRSDEAYADAQYALGGASAAAAWAGDGSVSTSTPSLTQQIAEGTASLNLHTRVDENGALLDEVTLLLSVDGQTYYTIEVTDADGAVIGVVTQWVSGTYDANLSEAAKLDFTVVRADPVLPLLRFPNKLVLRDRYGLILDRFSFKGYIEHSEGEGLFVSIVGMSVLAQLQREQIIYYSESDTVLNHVKAFLTDQLQTPTVSLGSIDEAIAISTVTLELEATTVLDGLHRIHGLLDPAIAGHFFIDANNALQWKVEIGNTITPIVAGRNLRGVKWEYDDSELVTRLTLVGEGQDELNRPSVTVTNNTGTYGIVPMLKVDRRIHKLETLQAKADAIIAVFSSPKVVFEVDVLDLAKADLQTYWQYGDYYVGGKHRLEAPAQGLSEAMTIHGLVYDLSNPVPVKVKSGNRSSSLANVLRGMESKIPASTNVNKGNQYNNISRLYGGDEYDDVDGDGKPTAEGMHDLVWKDGDLAYFDDALKVRQESQARWVGLVPMYVATTEAQLPNDAQVPQIALGRVTTTTGTQDAGDLYKRNGNNNGWEEINSGNDWQIYTANSVDELPDGVLNTSFGRVTSGNARGAMYVRDRYNTKWVSFTHWHNVDED